MTGARVLAYLRSLCRDMDEGRTLRAFGLSALALPLAVGLGACEPETTRGVEPRGVEVVRADEPTDPAGAEAHLGREPSDSGRGGAPDGGAAAVPDATADGAPPGRDAGPAAPPRLAPAGLGRVLGQLDAGTGLNPLYFAPCATCLYGVTDPGGGILPDGPRPGSPGARPLGRVAVRLLSVGPGLERATAERVVRSRAAGFQRCYERGLASDPALAGQLVLRLAVAPDGSVSAAEVERDGVDSDAVRDCVVAFARRLRFPRSEPGSPLEVRVACMLSPAD